MSNNTQFAGFGHAVIARMLSLRGGWIDFNEWDTEEIEEYSAIVAQAGYDLAMHAFESADPGILKRWMQGESLPLFDALVESVSDMPEETRDAE
jgi:hypothetical protein